MDTRSGPTANTEERNKSLLNRYGNRYYPVDPSYDKRVYENTASNYFRITMTLFGFWAFNAAHWWGVLALGIVSSEALGWYSIACFFFTIFFLAGLLLSGKYANAMKRKHEFLKEKIAEVEAKEQDERTKEQQAQAHTDKINA